MEAPWVATCARYLDELVEWNQKIDLTAARSAEELVDLTVVDAAIMASASSGEGAWVDVGSGAGAPGLILAMMLPEARMTLVEPRDRRVAFLRSAIGKFGLTNTTVVRGRSDRMPQGGADVAVARATLPPAEWLREGARIAKSAVWVLLAREEPPSLAGFTSADDLRYEWPLTQVPRRAVRYVRE
ncbi:MAG TPA: RsmG family class I SAM-dependent methyltransferase [Polyangiaceae bacterium]|nr:RsmG family class I SAM-dependent methyltransferase [Polyangiaceae bacterium]